MTQATLRREHRRSLPGNGYDTVIFDGGLGDDPDLAFIRINAGKLATVQFAFKISLAGENRFMYSVLADAGFKDITSLDYVDRYTDQKRVRRRSKRRISIRSRRSLPWTTSAAMHTALRGNGREPTGIPKK